MKSKRTKPELQSGRSMLAGAAAKELGVGIQTLHFYEGQGFIPRPPRSASGYRLYTLEIVERVRFIRKAQALGFSLEEVRRILNLRRGGKETCASVIAIAEATLAETESKLRELEAFRDSLRRNLARWKRAPKKACALSDFCVLIDSAPMTSTRSAREVPRTGEAAK